MTSAKHTAQRAWSNNTLKMLITGFTTVLVAIVGAWGTAQATAGSSNTPTRGEVRQMIQQEAPVNARDASQLYQTLVRIEAKITDLQVTEAQNQVIVQQIEQKVDPYAHQGGH